MREKRFQYTDYLINFKDNFIHYTDSFPVIIGGIGGEIKTNKKLLLL